MKQKFIKDVIFSEYFITTQKRADVIAKAVSYFCKANKDVSADLAISHCMNKTSWSITANWGISAYCKSMHQELMQSMLDNKALLTYTKW